MSPRMKSALGQWGGIAGSAIISLAVAATVSSAAYVWKNESRVTVIETKILVLDKIQATQEQDSALIQRIAGKMGVR